MTSPHTPAPPLRRYRVRINYREPTYALARHIDEQTYSCLFVVEARDVERAKHLAQREFEHEATLSQVGWTRIIVDVVVE